MKKKGFTLIELLAVIVILAIIAIIAVPIILNVIDTARKGSKESSVLGYIDAVEKRVMMAKVNGVDIKPLTYTVEQLDSLGVEIKGEKPDNTSVLTINNKGAVKEGWFTYNGTNYKIYYDGNKAVASKGNDYLDDKGEKHNTIATPGTEGLYITTISGTITDRNGKPVKNQAMVAYSEPCYFTTDESGHYEITLYNGEHNIYFIPGISMEELRNMGEEIKNQNNVISASINTEDTSDIVMTNMNISFNIANKDVISLTKNQVVNLELVKSDVGSDVSWTSSDSTIATVDNGTVTALKSGTVTITATSKYASDSITFNVHSYVVESGDLNTIGSVVKIGNEYFYVFGKEGNNIKLMTKFNLNANFNAQNTGVVSCTGTAGGGHISYGNSTYENSNIKPRVDGYVTVLQAEESKVKSGRIITKEEFQNTEGCTVYADNSSYSNAGSCASSPYSWIYAEYYWGSTVIGGRLLSMISNGTLYREITSRSDCFGIRPIIIMEP